MWNELEIAWASGFFEGDGSIGSYARTSGPRPGKAPTINLSVAQVDKEPLDRYVSALGVGRVMGPYDRSNTGSFGRNSKPMYRVELTAHEAVQQVVAMMWPWLSVRRRTQASLALASHVRGGAKKGRPVAHGSTGYLPAPATEGPWGGARLAWAAGFFDAEGSISNVARSPNRRGSTRIALQLWQVDKEPLEKFVASLGFGAVVGPYAKAGSSVKSQPQWYVAYSSFESVQQAIALMWPWLSERRRAQATMAMHSYLADTPSKSAPRSPVHLIRAA